MEINLQDLELDIANIIKGLSTWEHNIETSRINLFQNPNFDIRKVWSRIFSRFTFKDTLSVDEFHDFLAEHRIACSKKEVKFLIDSVAEKSGTLTGDSFVTLLIPKTDENLRNKALRKVEIQEYEDHMINNVSEIEVAKLFGQEIEFYREIEALRKKLASDYGMRIWELFKLIDIKQVGYLDYNSLSEFMLKNKINFSIQEYYAYLLRINPINLEIDPSIEKQSYQEFVNALIPRESFDYPIYRKQFDANEARDKVVKKACEFNLDIGKYVYNNNTQSKKQDPKYPFFPFRTVFDPYKNGRLCFANDQNYLSEFKDYQKIYYKPNRDHKFQYQRDTGVRYHDHHFKDFYRHLYERDQAEKFFNEFGKRYKYQDYTNNLRFGNKDKQARHLDRSPTLATIYKEQNYSDFAESVNEFRETRK